MTSYSHNAAADSNPNAAWRTTTLGEVLTLRKEIIHPRDQPTGTLPFVGLEHIASGTGARTGALETDLTSLTGRKARFYPGDIVYGYLRPYLNKVWLADFDGVCSVDQYVYSVDTSRADSGFVAWYMRSPRYLAIAPISETPGQLPRIRTQEVAEVPIPLPPLPTQRRFAAQLTAQLAEVDSARAAVQAQLKAAKGLPAAALRDVFGDTARGDARPPVRESARIREGERPREPVVQRDEWQYGRLQDVCELLPSKSIQTHGDTLVRAITTACLTETGFDVKGLKQARMAAAHIPECIVKRGEILVARSNTPELVGRAAIFDGEADGVVATDLTIRLWPRASVMGDFLATYLTHLFATGYWRERASGASGSMKKITRHQISLLEVPIPPHPIQRALAARLRAELAAAAELRASLEARLASLDRLPAALLRQVFG